MSGFVSAVQAQIIEVNSVNKAILLLSSITYAIRAQKLLERHGIATTMKKITGDASSNQGCGYGLELTAEPAAAIKLLGESGIKVTNVLRTN